MMERWSTPTRSVFIGCCATAGEITAQEAKKRNALRQRISPRANMFEKRVMLLHPLIGFQGIYNEDMKDGARHLAAKGSIRSNLKLWVAQGKEVTGHTRIPNFCSR
jgi:hypothetical protein